MRRRRRRRWDELDAEDPAAGLLNLFDVWIAFAAALLVAIGGEAARGLGAQSESVPGENVRLVRCRATGETASGEGERLGTAYRLPSGEVVYVPDREDAR